MTPEHELDSALAHVEARFQEILTGSAPLVLKYAAEVSKGHGKRIRPRLMVATARMFGRPGLDGVLNCAACCELLHTASLIHDDVIDEASLRRGIPTLNYRYGNEIAVVVGDYMLALVLEALTEERDFALTGMLLTTSKQLGLGVIEEVLNRNNFRLSVQKYYEVIHYKTAALFGLCTSMGAYLGGAGPEIVALATEYGEHVGMAFQIVDDLLDVLQDAAHTGKPAFSDLREGRITLPWIHALEAQPAETKRLVEAFQDGASHSAEHVIREHLVRLGSVEFAFGAAQEFLNAACASRERLRAHATEPEASVELGRIEERILSVLPLAVTAAGAD
jgi:geranylgeranyl pyrophosphate synthase